MIFKRSGGEVAIMKYFVKHFEGGFQVLEKEGDDEIAIASFHKDPQTQTGQKSKAQRLAEEYCDFLNQKDLAKDDSLTFD
jgi:hypothetical protein